MLTAKVIKSLQIEQKELDRIIQENYVKRNNISEYDYEKALTRIKIALFVEIGELANELKTFKHWKVKKETDWGKVKEELIDCLHFFLSLTNFFEVNFSLYTTKNSSSDTFEYNELLLELFSKTEEIPLKKNITPRRENDIHNCEKNKSIFYDWLIIFEKFCQNLEMNEDEIRECYMKKNSINRERQINKY